MTFTAAAAAKIFDEAWAPEFTSMDSLLDRIKQIATLGGYQDFVHVDNRSEFGRVKAELSDLGFHVVDYNNDDSNIIEISWG